MLLLFDYFQMVPREEGIWIYSTTVRRTEQAAYEELRSLNCTEVRLEMSHISVKRLLRYSVDEL